VSRASAFCDRFGPIFCPVRSSIEVRGETFTYHTFETRDASQDWVLRPMK
jgi:hypothetical protein